MHRFGHGSKGAQAFGASVIDGVTARRTGWRVRLERIRRPPSIPAPGEVVPAGRQAGRKLGDVGLAHGKSRLGLQVGEHRDGNTVHVELEPRRRPRPARCRSRDRRRSRSRSRTASLPGTWSGSLRPGRSRTLPSLSDQAVRGRDGDDDEGSHDDLLGGILMATRWAPALKPRSRQGWKFGAPREKVRPHTSH